MRSLNLNKLRSFLSAGHGVVKTKLSISLQPQPTTCGVPAYGILAFARHFGQPAAQTHPHLIAEGEVTPGMKQSEFLKRRCKLVQAAIENFRGVKSVNGHLFVFPSSSTSYMTNDIPYVFRQNTDFLYYSGFQEPDSILLIEVDRNSQDGEHKSSLFVPKRDPSKELWDGPRSGCEGAVMLTGVSFAHNSSDLEKYLHYYNHQHQDYVLWYDNSANVNNKIYNRILAQLFNDKKHKCIENPVSISHRLRLFKSPAEAELMQKSVDIASEAFVETMKFSRPKINEAHLWAKMDFECRLRGAEFLAYPPVVAGGNRANIIHYITNNQVVEAGDMVLMDAGCELHGYASDLTRTWPVNGHFTAPQRDLYVATLRVQEQCVSLCTSAHSLDEVYFEMMRLLGEELMALGVIPAGSSRGQIHQLTRKFCPHHVSHYLGMDVHDTNTVSRTMKLKPNMIVTVEPGIYIKDDDMSVAPEYRGIGIRIEDNVLITDTTPINLSASCPKTVEEIEDVMARR